MVPAALTLVRHNPGQVARRTRYSLLASVGADIGMFVDTRCVHDKRAIEDDVLTHLSYRYRILTHVGKEVKVEWCLL